MSPIIDTEATKLKQENICKPTVDFSVGNSASADLAILSSCNHSVVTAGSFGWWAAWLANGYTVYYGNYPPFDRVNLTSHARDYIPTNWFGIV
jgi:galactoside 2-L-fucosyltransferase 1/2